MEIITFFSFKGGVGRTQALLNTACEFAQRGKNVLLIDFDLHAPGLSLMECMKAEEDETNPARPGVLDFFEWLVLLDEAVRRGEPPPPPINLAACAYSPVIASKLKEGAGFLKLVPAALLKDDCSGTTHYSDRVHAMDAPLTEVIRRTHKDGGKNPVIEQIRSQFVTLPEAERPDAIFIDARTGITGIADLLLTQSSDRIVLVTGLNQQNLWGLESTLLEIQRSVETADWLRRITIVVSPVPLGELELTEKRSRAIADTLGRHVDVEEREMFGEIGLVPTPIQIPYNAQLALLEDPILLRHEDSEPAKKYRHLADRLGGKIEPLRFKLSGQDEAGKQKEDGLPLEHPLTKALSWDAGLEPKVAKAILSSLTSQTEPDKPYPGWLRHALNYLANTPAFNSEGTILRGVLLSLPRMTKSERSALLETFRKERQHLFSVQKSDWPGLAGVLGAARALWIQALAPNRHQRGLDWKALVNITASVTGWASYWTNLAEELRLQGLRQDSVDLLMAGVKRFSDRPEYYNATTQILTMADAYQEALIVVDSWLNFEQSHDKLGLVDAWVKKAQILKLLGRPLEGEEILRCAEASAREGSPTTSLANTLFFHGELLVLADKLEEARTNYDEALEIYRKVKSRNGEGNTLRSLGELLVRTGRLEEARSSYDEALAIFRAVKQRHGEASTLRSLGDLLVRTGKLEQAQSSYNEALAIFREVKERLGEANTLKSLGDLLVRTGKLEEAQSRYDRAMGIYREVKARVGEAYSLQSLGELLVRTEKLEEALNCYEESLAIFREVKERLGEANTLISLGDLQVITGKLEEARYSYDDALGIFREIKDRLGEANTLKSLGELLLRTGKFKEARASYDKAMVIYRDIKEVLGEANTLKSLGDLLLQTKKLDEARSTFDAALSIYREIKEVLGEANALQGLAKWHLAKGNMTECQEQTNDCLKMYADLADSEGEWEAKMISAKVLAAKGEAEKAKEIVNLVKREAISKGYVTLAREANDLLEAW